MHPTALQLAMAHAGLTNPWRRPGTHCAMRVYIAAGGPFGAFREVR